MKNRKLKAVLIALAIGAQAAAAETPEVLAIGVNALKSGVDVIAIVGEEDYSFNPYWEAVREIITAEAEGREADITADYDVCLPEAEALAALQEGGK
jgi:hypothetical protein